MRGSCDLPARQNRLDLRTTANMYISKDSKEEERLDNRKFSLLFDTLGKEEDLKEERECVSGREGTREQIPRWRW